MPTFSAPAAAGFVVRVADPVDRRVKRVFLTKRAGRFLERLRKETDKFNERIVNGIDRSNLEWTSDALLAMKRNLLALPGGVAAGTDDDENAKPDQKVKPHRRRKAGASAR